MITSYLSSFKNWASKQKVRSSAGKIKISLISIVLGLIFGAMIVVGLKGDVGLFFSELFTNSFKSDSSINQLLIFTSIFALSGIANAFAFKTGLFNIGVAGQMLAGGGIAALLSLTIFKSLPSAVAIPLLVIIAALVAGIVGMLVGFIKTKFNVHEVVSTILLNWVIFYVMKFIFPPDGSRSFMNTSGVSDSFPHKFFEGAGIVQDKGWPVAIAISLIVLVSIFLILRFTVFGKNLKMTGINKEASRYAGINVNRAIISSMTISALISGILGVVYYFGNIGRMTSFSASVLPSVGFDGIALALLAFNSPIAMLPMSFLYALFKVSGFGSSALDPSISKETISLIFSAIIYFAAISSLFYRFRIFYWIKITFITNRTREIKLKNKEYKSAIKNINNQIIETIKQLGETNKQLKETNKLMRKAALPLKTINGKKQKKNPVSGAFVNEFINKHYQKVFGNRRMALHEEIAKIKNTLVKYRDTKKEIWELKKSIVKRFLILAKLKFNPKKNKDTIEKVTKFIKDSSSKLEELKIEIKEVKKDFIKNKEEMNSRVMKAKEKFANEIKEKKQTLKLAIKQGLELHKELCKKYNGEAIQIKKNSKNKDKGEISKKEWLKIQLLKIKENFSKELDLALKEMINKNFRKLIEIDSSIDLKIKDLKIDNSKINDSKNELKRKLKILKKDRWKLRKEKVSVVSSMTNKKIAKIIEVDYSISGAFVKEFINKHYRNIFGNRRIALHEEIAKIKNTLVKYRDTKKEIWELKKSIVKRFLILAKLKFNPKKNKDTIEKVTNFIKGSSSKLEKLKIEIKEVKKDFINNKEEMNSRVMKAKEKFANEIKEKRKTQKLAIKQGLELHKELCKKYNGEAIKIKKNFKDEDKGEFSKKEWLEIQLFKVKENFSKELGLALEKKVGK